MKHLPESFRELSSLQTLNLSSNRLKTLSYTLAQLPLLQVLELFYYNQLTNLPDFFLDIPKLRYLYISQNHLNKDAKIVL
ncbi:MAG: leucine-rich repeat domain-containing protein [Promethearchaeota archaeon]